MFLTINKANLPVCGSEQISKSRGCYWLLALVRLEDEFCQRAGNVTGYRQPATASHNRICDQPTIILTEREY